MRFLAFTVKAENSIGKDNDNMHIKITKMAGRTRPGSTLELVTLPRKEPACKGKCLTSQTIRYS